MIPLQIFYLILTVINSLAIVFIFYFLVRWRNEIRQAKKSLGKIFKIDIDELINEAND